jgi:hypothetical protein
MRNCGSGFRIRISEKFIAGNLISISLIKNCNLLILKPKLQEKPSTLKREHPVLKNMKIMDFSLFCGSFLPSWIRIGNLNADPDPDPATQINADPDPKPGLSNACLYCYVVFDDNLRASL